MAFPEDLTKVRTNLTQDELKELVRVLAIKDNPEITWQPNAYMFIGSYLGEFTYHGVDYTLQEEYEWVVELSRKSGVPAMTEEQTETAPDQTPTFRELVEQAMSDVETYKYPTLDAFINRVDPILEAMNRGSIGRDNVDFIGIHNGKVIITTSYTVRGCDQSDDYTFPESFLDEPDPVRSAQIWYIDDQIKRFENQLIDSQNSVARYQIKLAELYDERNQFL